ncbi:FGGY-family carbohydrate kinase [Paenibacillus arenilitoris]|uniref:Carbohydrate kinase n=1 Tax=Paenibacillus arenilitoris TaxID=2772299 RepID=A0A927H4U9_9BACL|nr:FGGY family carbohydrate kinase [Paenibacillus arenilitoris]MBD2868801.1 carbohydrate kinase [Paenibacillus arenilitoris]
MIIGLDIGTTNMKAGLFDERGRLLAEASSPNECRTHADGFAYYDPERLWTEVAAMIRRLAAGEPKRTVRAIGIASMAESGLLADRSTGKPRSPIVPWFERCSLEQAKAIENEVDAFERFRATGLRPSFKYGLAKLLWLKERNGDALRSAVWLSVSSYIANRLTGRLAEDYTLAARTYAFRMADKRWDAPLLRHFGLEEALFPPAVPAGAAAGSVTTSAAEALGLPDGVPVFLAGHDHVCASLAVGSSLDGGIYNSMGTAETVVGAFAARELTKADFASGLAYGFHPVPGHLFWLGGHSSSGGSVEWMRGILGDEKVGYERILELLDEAPPSPSGIIYLPYLTGCGAPTPDPYAKAAFIGLTARHGRGELLRAVLEGSAYQMESIRRCAEAVSGSPIRLMRVVGGGVRNRRWLQIKADVSGITLEAPDIPEAALAGAAITAGVGFGLYGSYEEAARVFAAGGRMKAVFEPDPERHARYAELYERQFLKFCRALAGA